MSYGGHFQPHDDVLAHRLVLAALNDDDAAYDVILADLRCLGCAHRLISALVDLTTCEVLLHQTVLGLHVRERHWSPFTGAIAAIEERLLARLDALDRGEA